MAAVREKIAWALAGTLALLVLAALAGRIEGGPLDPVSGPGTPTDGVRLPGTPISALPFTAGEPGSYYLTKDLSSNVGGIVIASPHVTLDLNGFTLSSTNTALTAVTVDPDITGARIRNGRIVGWGSGVRHQGSLIPTSVVVEDVVLSNTSTHAILLQQTAVVRNCAVLASGGFGIFIGFNGLVENCRVAGAGNVGIHAGARSVVRGCDVSGVTASAAAIEVVSGVVDQCIAHDNAGPGILVSRSRIVDTVSESNGGAGIALGEGSVALNCVARGNAGAGITTARASIIESCVSEANTNDGVITDVFALVHGSTVSNNFARGIEANSANLIEANALADNDFDGIDAFGRSRILNNTLRFNGDLTANLTDGAGITLGSIANYVEGNDLTSNDVGIDSPTGSNVIVRNTARNNGGGNYLFQLSDLAGVIVALANHLSSAIPHYNYTP